MGTDDYRTPVVVDPHSTTTGVFFLDCEKDVIMSKPSERRRRKQKARERADAKAMHIRREIQRYAENYPKLVFHVNDAPPAFAELVRNALQDIDFRDSRLFSPKETKLYKAMKQNPAAVMPVLSALVAGRNLGAINFTTRLGQLAH